MMIDDDANDAITPAMIADAMMRANALRNAEYAQLLDTKSAIGDIRANRSIRRSHSHSRPHRAIR